MRKAATYGSLDADEDRDDREADYISITNVTVSEVVEVKGTTWDNNPLTKQHHTSQGLLSQGFSSS